MKNRIERIEEILAYSDPRNKWIKLFFDKVRFKDQVGFYNRIVEGDGKPGVVILPVKKDLIGLIYLHRYPIDEYVWELPRGFGETENAVVDAMTELREETGIKVQEKDIYDLGRIYPNSGILVSSVRLFYAKCDNAVETSIYGKEVVEFKWFDHKEIIKNISDGVINDAFTICALMRAKLKGYLYS